MSRLLTTGILQQAKNNLSGWTPIDLADLLAWYDASDAATITESSGAVSQWNDKSGNGNNQLQSNVNFRPLTGIRTLNGNNVIYFDGVDDYLNCTTLGGVSDVTIIAVHKYDILSGVVAGT